jgi:hypothetical protein
MLRPPVATAQTPAPPAAEQPGGYTPAFDPLPGFPRPPDAPRTLYAPALAAPLYGCAPLPEKYFVQGDPLLDPPELPQPGWFIDVGVGVVKPHFTGIMGSNTVQIGNLPPDTVAGLPSASLDWTGAPQLQIGHRLPTGFGEFALSFRGLGTQGTGSIPAADGLAVLRSRLDFSQIGADYLSREYSLLPEWDMKWHLGVRLVYLYFDSRADEPFDLAAAGSGVFEQRTTNSYWGIGPNAGLELARRVDGTGLSFVGRVDCATVLGRIRQGFFETSTTTGPGGQFLSGETRISGSQDVPLVNVQVGLSWNPPIRPCTQLFLGYNYEHWWNIGKVSNFGTAGELTDQGLLLRLAINF